MVMTGSRRVEVIAGFATGLVALLGPSSFNLARFIVSSFSASEKLLGLLSLVLTHLGPALLVAIGSYVHAVRQRTAGFVMVLVGGLLVTILGVVAFLGGLFYALGPLQSVLTLLPSATAIVTMTASLLARKSIAKVT